MNVTISFTLNGKPVSVEAPTHINLLDLLRDYLNQTGAKFGCEQGNCGACTVILNGEAVNACLVLAPTVEGKAIRTVEGLGTLEQPHPLQMAFYEKYAAQCGFCTPGMLMSSVALLEHNTSPTREEVVEAIVGNVCRCTGYVKIVDAVLAAADAMQNEQ